MRAELYVKPGCPWCEDALAYFRQHEVSVEVIDVLADRQAYERMIEISGQSKTPTLVYGAFYCADFDLRELEAALSRHPRVQEALGLSPQASSL